MSLSIAAVIIGRNEGARLERCLASLSGQGLRLIYVDSGSRDNSVAAARAAGAEVVELDPATPFTAARARSAGVAALAGDMPDAVQFVDGDCAVVPGWIAAGARALQDDPTLALSPAGAPSFTPNAAFITRFAITNGTARRVRSWPVAAI